MAAAGGACYFISVKNQEQKITVAGFLLFLFFILFSSEYNVFPDFLQVTLHAKMALTNLKQFSWNLKVIKSVEVTDVFWLEKSLSQGNRKWKFTT